MINERNDSYQSETSSGGRTSLTIMDVQPHKPLHKYKHTWDIEGKRLINSSRILSSLHHKDTRKLLKYLLLQGVPPKYRYKYWLNISGATREKINNKDYYKSLITNYPDYIPSKYEKIIQADLHRTFPDDPYFKKEENITKLKNILIAYSRRNNSIGYYQGFNFIEDSFWIFTQIIECILPVEYYSELSGMMVDCASTLKVFKILQKETMNHLNALNGEIFINNLLSQWFLSLFVHKTNMETFLIIWDAMFFEGYIVLIRAAIGILCIMKDRLLQLQTLEQLITFFDKDIAMFNQNEILSQFILDENCTISNDVVRHFRKLLLPAYVETITKSKENIPDVNNNEMECDLDWPFCVDNFANCKINSCIVLTTTQGIVDIREDFYTGNVTAKVEEYKQSKKKEVENKGKVIKKNIVDISELEHLSEQYNVYKDLLIEREVHTCGCGKESSKEIQEQMKTKNNLFYKYYYENKDGSSKKTCIASSYFDFHDLKKNTKTFADIINNIEQRLENQHAVITLKRSKSRHQKRKEVQERKELIKEDENENESEE